MRTHLDDSKYKSAGVWAKKYYLASRAVMESTLRPYDLGPTQWYVLWQLVNNGPTAQRDFLDMLHVEKPTLSEIVSALVRKGFIEQMPDPADQRQRVLTITPTGLKLWQELPDPIDLILNVAFEGVEEAELATVARVLQAATQRLNHHLTEGTKK
jgi:DNA-binding MarR family transcriptional regulator